MAINDRSSHPDRECKDQHSRGGEREAPWHDRGPRVARMNEHIEGRENEHDDVAKRVRPCRRLSAHIRSPRKSIRPKIAARTPKTTPTLTSHAEKSAHIMSADLQYVMSVSRTPTKHTIGIGTRSGWIGRWKRLIVERGLASDNGFLPQRLWGFRSAIIRTSWLLLGVDDGLN